MLVTTALVVGGCTLVFVLLFSLFVARSFLKPPFLVSQPGGKLGVGKAIHPAWGTAVHNPKHDFGFLYEDVEFDAGGLHGGAHKCRGWLIDRRGTPQAKSIAVVFVHGGGRDRRAFLRHSQFVVEAGYSCLLYDSRGHGTSDGATGLTMGVREHEDAVEAVSFMKSRGFQTIVLIGTSIGGTSSILAAHKLPGDVVGVIAENPFTSIAANIDGLVEKVAFFRVLCCRSQRRTKMSTPLMFLCKHAIRFEMLRQLGPGARVHDVNAINVIRDVAKDRRILLIHGTADQLIHHSHSEQLHQAADSDSVDLWIAEGADHTAIQNVFPKEYRTRVLGFLAAIEKQES